jgi:hypothetical protein
MSAGLLRFTRNDVILYNIASLRGVLNLIGEAIQKNVFLQKWKKRGRL